MKINQQIRCQCWFLPALAALFAWPLIGVPEGIVFEQLPPSPSLGLVQNTNGVWVDPLAPYDSQGLRLWGTPENPTNHDLVLGRQVAFTFNSGSDFDIAPTGSNQVLGVYLDELGTEGAAPLPSGYQIGPDAGASYTWLGGDTVFLATVRASGTIGSPLLFSGPFAGVASAYIGLEFYVSNQVYYGWVRVGAPVSINGGWIYDFAYETSADTPIQAGQVSEPISFTANLTGANETPPNRSGNSGTGTFTQESFLDGFILTYHVELDGSFRPTDAGIFAPPIREGRYPVLIADLGMAQIVFPTPPPIGPVTFAPATANQYPSTIILPPPSHIVYNGQISLSSNQVVQLQSGQLYVNLESAKFRHGELRGQIFPSAPVQFSATLSSHTEFSRSHNVPHGEAQFTLSGTALSYEIALDTNFTRIIAGIYDPGFPQAEIGNRMIWLNTTNAVRIPPGGIPNSPGLPGQLLYSGGLTLPDRQINELENGQSYLEVLAPGCRNGWIGGRITQIP